MSIAFAWPDPGFANEPSDKSASPLQEAAKLRTEGYYDRAAEAYTQLLDNDAHALDAALGLVACQLETGQYADARQQLESCRNAGVRSARWHLAFSELSSLLGAYDDAITHARRAVKLNRQMCRARLLLADTLSLTGKTDEALDEYEWFDRLVAVRLPEDAESLTAAGLGFYRYSVRTQHPNLTKRTRHVLGAVFQACYELVDPTYWPARVAAADLLREKYNLEEAEEDYRQALRINTSAADAHIGLGRIALEGWDFEAIEHRVQRALEINPNHVGAFNLLATCRIVERRYNDALETSEKALAINPNDIESLALKASALVAMNRGEEANKTVARAKSVNPASSRFNAILADTLGGLRQFAAAEALYQEAIAADPTAALPRIELGLMYMQWGDEAKARGALEQAWKVDPFNERTKNTLDLLDELEAFDRIETEHFSVRFDGETDAITGRYFADYLESIYDPVCSAYNAKLPRKTIIEVFPTHSQFGVRVTGKPWIHTVGACTGWVIAMDAPRYGTALQGPYDYASVLRHEFTHTVTLAITNNRIPHWFTEGLAVMQENADRDYAWMELLADAVRRNELFTLDTIDWGFMRPKRATDRTLAYAQSEWMCEFLIERFGADILGRMLAGHRDGKTQPEVFREVTGESTRRFDERFAKWATAHVRSWGFDLTPPDNVVAQRAWAALNKQDTNAQAKLARAELDAGNLDRAIEAARSSVSIDERDNAAGLEILIRVLDAHTSLTRDKAKLEAYAAEAAPHAARLLELAPDNRFALKAMAQIALQRHDDNEAKPYLKRLKDVWPADPFAAGNLARIQLEENDDESALVNLLDVARMNLHDPDVPYQIGLIYMRQKQLPQARDWLSRALHVDPLMESAHRELAEIHMRAGDTRLAIEQYEMLCRIVPTNATYPSACALAHYKLGDKETARRYAAMAAKLEPNTPAASLLDE